MEQALRIELVSQRMRRRMIPIAAVAIASGVVLAPRIAVAENLFDFLFSGLQRQLQRQAPTQAGLLADPASPHPVVAGSGPAFCVRSCDGRYFPLMRGTASPAQMCQAFCPASATKVYFGSSIDSAYTASGERYADSQNAFAYRKALRADCTCNGRDPAGLAAIDLTLDTSLRAGDVIATTDGLVAYSGVRVGNNQTAEFTPIASYPGLTAEVRARLKELKVAPARADMIANDLPGADVSRDLLPPVSDTPKAPLRDTRAEAD